MTSQSETLPPELLERVLRKLGFSDRPEPTLGSLTALYAAWCRRVPFDNVRKLIHMREGQTGPLPGDGPEDFFVAWLAHGTGGTCWAGNGGLYDLLTSLDYEASRGIATMVTSPDVPPNHGTVLVDLDGVRYMVDASILHNQPLLLVDGQTTAIPHGAWGVEARQQDGRWHIRWRPLHTPAGIDCRIEHVGASGETFSESYEATRAWSPFNYELNARLIRGDALVGVAFGQHVTLDAGGAVDREPISGEDRVRLLIEELGMSEEIARQLPPDEPTPPPPWSRSPSDSWLGRPRDKLAKG